MGKTHEQKLKEMKKYRNRYKKLYFHEQVLKIFIIISLINFLVAVYLKKAHYSYEIEMMVFIMFAICLSLIFLVLILYIRKDRILIKYLILACKADIELSNSLKFYKINKSVDKISSVKVREKSPKKYEVVIELIVSGEEQYIYIEVEEAIFYMDIY